MEIFKEHTEAIKYLKAIQPNSTKEDCNNLKKQGICKVNLLQGNKIISKIILIDPLGLI